MTKARLELARRWPAFAVATVVLALTTAGLLLVLWVQAEHTRAALAREANLRGQAVSTLATDVRALRVQVQAEGRTPVAPDPSRAVSGLPERAQVPVLVPVPGPSGAPGRPAPTPNMTALARLAAGLVTPSPGPSGAAGVNGTDGRDGRDGADGQPPAGWTWVDPSGNSYECDRAPDFDPANPRYVCTATSTPSPSPSSPAPASSSPAALDPRRKH